MAKNRGPALIVFFCLFTRILFSQFSFDSVFNSHPVLKKITSEPSKYHLQIIYTQVDYKNGKPVFTDYLFNADPKNYFYCASLVKLPVSILALQKLNELNITSDAIMFTDSSISCHRKVKFDTTTANKYPSIENYIRKMLVVSENEGYSRTYEFLGVDYIQGNLKKLGFPDIRIVNRYDGNCTGKDNFITNPVTFLDKNLMVIYEQGAQFSIAKYPHPLKKVTVGKGYYTMDKRKINSPKDFSTSNHMSLTDCHSILKELLYGQENGKFNLTNSQKLFLIDHLSYFPRQCSTPKYDPKVYYDSYKKYLFYGDSKKTIVDTNLIITNIVGQSYGFMADCARFLDRANKVEFMLSAVIYANEDEILNDGKYDYKTVALPYLAELGRQFYNYELRRISNKEK
jgi:hypothetical protein